VALSVVVLMLNDSTGLLACGYVDDVECYNWTISWWLMKLNDKTRLFADGFVDVEC
jgi:hypothetical protein